jgi:hypothetical protein
VQAHAQVVIAESTNYAWLARDRVPCIIMLLLLAFHYAA